MFCTKKLLSNLFIFAKLLASLECTPSPTLDIIELTNQIINHLSLKKHKSFPYYLSQALNKSSSKHHVAKKALSKIIMKTICTQISNNSKYHDPKSIAKTIVNITLTKPYQIESLILFHVKKDSIKKSKLFYSRLKKVGLGLLLGSLITYSGYKTHKLLKNRLQNQITQLSLSLTQAQSTFLQKQQEILITIQTLNTKIVQQQQDLTNYSIKLQKESLELDKINQAMQELSHFLSTLLEKYQNTEKLSKDNIELLTNELTSIKSTFREICANVKDLQKNQQLPTQQSQQSLDQTKTELSFLEHFSNALQEEVANILHPKKQTPTTPHLQNKQALSQSQSHTSTQASSQSISRIHL